jgi:hypothetical protein
MASECLKIHFEEIAVHQNECSVALFWIGALRTQAVKRRKRRLLQRRNVAFLMIFKRLLLGLTHEVAKSETKGCGQRIGDLNPHIHLTQLNRANICAVHIGSLRKVFLRELKFPSSQTDRSPKGESRESCCLRHAILLIS